MKREKVIMRIFSVLLLIAMLLSGCSLGKNKTEVPEDEISQMNQSEDGKIHVDGKFSDITIKDSESAIHAAQEAASKLDFENAFDELEEISVNEVEGLTYYRFQQKYEGYPVYGDTVVVMANSDNEAIGMTGNASDIVKADMNKGVSEQEVEENLTRYVQETLGYPDAEDVDIDGLFDQQLCVYNGKDEAYLAYKILVNFGYGLREFVLSANDGTIFATSQILFEDNVESYNSDKSLKFMASYDKNEKSMPYVMKDEKKNITVFTLDKKDSQVYGTELIDIKSEDNIYGNTERERKQEYNTAASFYVTMGNVTGFFQDNYGDSAYGRLTFAYNDGFDEGGNALGGGSESSGGIVYVGFQKEPEDVSLLAHEYMHVVTRRHIGWIENNIHDENQTGAINEAFSDLFGEIVEDYLDNNKMDNSCDWTHGKRTISDPGENGYPTHVDDEENGYWTEDGGKTYWSEDYTHGHSTVVSHAAYKMVHSTRAALSIKELSNLWYSTMLTLPADCDYKTLRSNMEFIAKNMGYSESKVETITSALDEAGIKKNSDNEYLQYKEKFTLAVYDINSKIYGEYNIHIHGKENQFFRHKEFDKTINVNVENPDDKNAIQEITLKKGTYTITVSDVNSKSYSQNIVIGPRGRSEMSFTTEFGVKEVLVTDFLLEENIVTTIGELYAIEPEIKPLNATGYTIKWSSSDENVATVSPSGEAGIVQSLAKGTATIKAELTTGEDVITKTVEVRVASKARDTVLVLDVSGSMYGAPIEEMKKSAIQFCEDLLKDEYNNRVGLVFYDNNVDSIDLTDDLDYLVSEISQISDGGTTDMEGGLAEADTMLKDFGRDDSVKNVIVMADGLPNRGETSDSGSMPSGTYDGYATSIGYANAVIDTAENMMQRYNLYSLGFFHDLYGEEKDFGTTLMQNLTNMTNGYYEVTEAEKLNFVFGDIQEEVSDGSKIVINIACPVDVNVTYEGETLSSASSTYNDKTSFGSLQLLGKNKDIKVVSLDADKKYNVKLQGTGEGTMNYSVNYYDEQETRTDYRSFTAVPITTKTVITSSTDNVVEKVLLNIDEDGDGTVDVVWAAEHSSEAEVIQKKTEEPAKIEQPDEPKDNTVILVVVGVMLGVMMLGAIVVVLVMASGSKKPEEEFVPVAGEKKEETEKKETKEKAIERKIVILTGSMEGIEFDIPSDKICYVGRDRRQCQISLLNTYTSVSRLHCTIQFSEKDNLYYVTDCSSNGTFWSDGRRMKKGQRTAVQIGSKILIANAGCKIALK